MGGIGALRETFHGAMMIINILEINRKVDLFELITLPDRDAIMGELLLGPAYRCAVHNEMYIVLSRPTVPVGGNDPQRRMKPWIILSVSTCRSKAAPFAS